MEPWSKAGMPGPALLQKVWLIRPTEATNVTSDGVQEALEVLPLMVRLHDLPFRGSLSGGVRRHRKRIPYRGEELVGDESGPIFG